MVNGLKNFEYHYCSQSRESQRALTCVERTRKHRQRTSALDKTFRREIVRAERLQALGCKPRCRRKPLRRLRHCCVGSLCLIASLADACWVHARIVAVHESWLLLRRLRTLGKRAVRSGRPECFVAAKRAQTYIVD